MTNFQRLTSVCQKVLVAVALFTAADALALEAKTFEIRVEMDWQNQKPKVDAFGRHVWYASLPLSGPITISAQPERRVLAPATEAVAIALESLKPDAAYQCLITAVEHPNDVFFVFAIHECN